MLVRILAAWSWEPGPLIDLALATTLYARGYWRLRRKAGGRVKPPLWRVGCYAAGIVSLALAFFSPLATYDTRYFFVHMLQHLLIGWVAPPLLWLGSPLVPTLWALPDPARRRLGALFRWGQPLWRLGIGLTTPYVALPIFLIVVAVWHVPSFYDAAQGDTLTHNLEHLTFFAAGLLYWWPIVQAGRGHRRLAPMSGGLLYLLASATEGGLIGGIFTFSDRVIYSFYLQSTPSIGLSPLADQHLAGIVMWLIGGLVDALAAFILIGSYLAWEERTLSPPGGARSTTRT